MRLIAILLLAVSLAQAGRPAEIELVANPLGAPEHAWYLGDYGRLDRWALYKNDCFHHRDSLTAPEAAVAISGRIDEGDAARFADVVAPYSTTYGPEVYECPRLVVLLDSGGGSLLEGIRLGRAIAGLGLATVVPPGAQCLSACAFVLAGGSFPLGEIPNMVVFAGTRIGLHQPQFDLSERQRQILAAAPDAPDLAYSLAGAQWTEIYDYMINARRNPFLLQLMLASPPEADRFNDLDSFEELYLAGMRLVAPEPPGKLLAAPGLLTEATARQVCALTLVRAGAQENFANAYATRLDGAVMVGLIRSEQFCVVTAFEGFEEDPAGSATLDLCLFQRTAFTEFDAALLPAYVEQYGYGAMGNFPIWMFDAQFIVDFAIPGEPAAETRSAIEAFVTANADRLCKRRESFFVADLQALENSMWIDEDCPAATRLCETGRPLVANLAQIRPKRRP